jgi:hypothetical protein
MIEREEIHHTLFSAPEGVKAQREEKEGAQRRF